MALVAKDFLHRTARMLARGFSALKSQYVPPGTPAYQQGYVSYGPNPHPPGSVAHADWAAGDERAFLDQAI